MTSEPLPASAVTPAEAPPAVAPAAAAQHEPPPAEPVWAFRFRRGLYISAAVGAAYMLYAIIHVATTWSDPPQVINIIGFAAFGSAVAFAIARSLYVIFYQMQARFIEWIATFAAIACFNFLVQLIFQERRSTDQLVAIGVIMGLVAITTMVGSTWAWSALRKLKIEEPRERLLMLVRGWLLMVGLYAGIVFIIWTVIIALVTIDQLLTTFSVPSFSWEDARIYGMFTAVSLLTVPGLRVMGRIRRLEKSKH